MTRIFFVRHAQPEHGYADDRTRPLTAEGISDAKIVPETLRDKNIDVFYCSPYKRSMDTIRGAAEYYGMAIRTDERLRERECGPAGNSTELLRKRWADRDYHEDGGESINMVQKRNIAALTDILRENAGKNIVIGTHGTALSSIMNYYRPEFGFEDFWRIVDWMPYIVELDFEGERLADVRELCHIEKVYNG